MVGQPHLRPLPLASTMAAARGASSLASHGLRDFMRAVSIFIAAFSDAAQTQTHAQRGQAITHRLARA